MQSNDTANRVKKKRKSNEATSSRVLTNRLSGLIGMPVDILFEIFGNLHPYDILRLSRLNKAFRRLLLDKSATGVWRTARERLDMPDKPQDMSEPAWIYLAFNPQCHFCWTKGCRTVEWRFRVRICGKCIKIHTKTTNSAVSLIEDMVPRSLAKKGKTMYLIRDYEAVAAKYNAITSPEDSQAFIAERKELIKHIYTHAEECEKWAQERASNRTQELEEIKNERQAAIIAKLTDLGYGEDLQGLKYYEEFTRAKPLTERGWNTIRGRLEEGVKQSKQERLARLAFSERAKPIVQLFQQYKNSRLPYNELMPGPIDLCNFSKVKTILTSDAQIDETTFSAIVATFDNFVEKWRNYKLLQLLYHVRRVEDKELRRAFLIGYDEEDKGNAFDFKSLKPLQDTIPDVMSSLVFVCDNCTPPISIWTSEVSEPNYFDRQVAEPLYYPEVLDHPCLTRNLSHRPRTESADTLKHLDHYDRDRGRWNCRILTVEKSLGRIFEAIVKLAGQNPGSTTAAAMDKLDMWFACLNPACLTWMRETDFWAYARNWRLAVKHHAESHPEDGIEFVTMTSYEVDFVRSRLLPLQEMVVLPKDFLCAHCRDLPSEQPPATIDAVKDHLKIEHDILDAKLDRDYYKRPNAPLRPAFGKGPLGESLEIFGDIPCFKVKMTTL